MIEQIKVQGGELRHPGLLDQHRTQEFHCLQRRRLLEVLFFVLISIAAYSCREFNLFAFSSEPVRQVLGYPPPAYLISIALSVYIFSVVIFILTQLGNAVEPTPKWLHLGYRSLFYVFYLCSGTLAPHFTAVLLGGLFLYGLELVHLWIYGHRDLEPDKDLLGGR